MWKLGNIPLKYRLPVLIVGFCIAAAALLQTFAYLEFRKFALNAAEVEFSAAARLRHDELHAWLDRIEQNTLTIAASPSTADAIVRLGTAFSGIPTSATAELQDAYITRNPFPEGERQKLVEVEGSFSYFRQHSVFHPYLDTVRERNKFYDIFLFDLQGNAIYTAFKERDFATNFLSGENATTALGRLLTVAKAGKPGEIFISDFEPYAPNNGIPAGFVATQVTTPDGKLVGYLAFQLALSDLTAAVVDADGLGVTGDAYLMGSDLKTRSASRFEGRFGILQELPSSPQIDAIRTGTEGMLRDVVLQSGNRGMAETLLIEAPGVTWGLIVERDLAEVMVPANSFLINMLIIAAASTVIVLGLGILIARSVTRPIFRVGQSIKAVADGDLDRPVSETERRDEVGQIACALDGLREKLMAADLSERERERLQAEQARVVEALSVGLQNLSAGNLTQPITEPFAGDYEMLRADFNRTLEQLNQTISQVVESSHSIRARSTEISRASEDLSHRTENQAATLEETAAALDELTASVKSAADGARQVETIVRQARKEAEDSGAVVQGAVAAMTEIKKSSEHISQIIGVIDDIAFQTNLLALNAGVEAARAGDAGRGFAVVASEVRALAQRSSAAAKEIKTLIGASTQHVGRGVDQVDRAGEALASIVDRVAHISTLVSDIAAGSGEQATGLAEINIGVTQLDQVTQQNAAMVEESTAASHSLHQEATGLADLVGRFATSSQAGRVVEMPRAEPAAMPRARAATQAATPPRREAKAAAGRGVWQEF